MNSRDAIPDRAAAQLRAVIKEYSLPAVSALMCGLAAYLFVFTNKLLNLDEIAGLFQRESR